MDAADTWPTEHTLAMLRAADDHIAAYLMCVKAFTPAELRGMAAALGLPDLDNLREVSFEVTRAARSIHAAEAVLFLDWAVLYGRNPREAAEEYHAQKKSERTVHSGRNT